MHLRPFHWVRPPVPPGPQGRLAGAEGAGDLRDPARGLHGGGVLELCSLGASTSVLGVQGGWGVWPSEKVLDARNEASRFPTPINWEGQCACNGCTPPPPRACMIKACQGLPRPYRGLPTGLPGGASRGPLKAIFFKLGSVGHGQDAVDLADLFWGVPKSAKAG